MSNELPGDWGKLLEPKGIHSYRELAAAADVPLSTVHRLVSGKTSAATVNQVADRLFDGNRDLVWALRGSTRRDFGDWDLPDGASLLTPAQRNAVRAVIQAMLPAEREEGERDERPPATKTPEVRPADQLTEEQSRDLTKVAAAIDKAKRDMTAARVVDTPQEADPAPKRGSGGAGTGR